MKNVYPLIIILFCITTLNSIDTKGVDPNPNQNFQFKFLGPGCKSENTKVVVEREKEQVVISPEKYFLESSSGEASRTHCEFAMQFEAPPNKKFVMKGATIRTVNKLPKASSSRFSGEFFITGTSGKVINKEYPGKLENTDIIHFESVESKCGASGIFRMNSSLVLTSSAKELSRAAVSLIQLNGISYKDCSN
jgi:hypothetical protein